MSNHNELQSIDLSQLTTVTGGNIVATSDDSTIMTALTQIEQSIATLSNPQQSSSSSSMMMMSMMMSMMQRPTAAAAAPAAPAGFPWQMAPGSYY